MSLDWYPGIRECCTYWSDAQMLQQTFQALETSFEAGNDACIDCAKAMVEVVCRVVIDELDDPTFSLRPVQSSPSLGDWLSAAVRVLKLGDVRHDKFKKLISQHHKLTEALGDLRNEAGPTSHGKDGFISRLSSHHRRAAVLTADAMVAFLHEAYLESEKNLARTREPYERFADLHVSINRHASIRLENDEYNDHSLVVSMPSGDEFVVSISPSQVLYHFDRTAYIEALRLGQDADGREDALFGFESVTVETQA